MVRDTVKTGCSAVILTKRSAFDLHFHLIVVFLFLKSPVKDRIESSSRLLERRI